MVKARIMIVEDVVVVAAHVKSTLTRLGYEVVATAVSGEEAIEKARATAPDLILMDIVLRGRMDGIESAEIIHAEADIPIIYLTAHSNKNVIERAKCTEPFAYLIKPFDVNELHVAIQMTLYKHEMERKLKESEERHRIVADFTFDWEYWIAPDRTLLYVSPSCERITGHSSEEFLNNGSLLIDIVHPEDRGAVTKHLQEDIDPPHGEPRSLEFRIIHQNGEIRWIGHVCQPVCGANGSSLGRRASNRDITAQKTAEAMAVRAERIKAVGDLARGVAHNFNNLLQIVMGASQVAQISLEKGDFAQVMAQLDQILESSRLGAQTVKSLDNFSRTRSDKGLALDTILDLSDVVSQALDATRVWWEIEPKDGSQGINLSRNLAPGCTVKGRRDELFEVTVNLVRNAVEASPEGGEIHVETLVEGKQVVLRVRDNGIGMSAETLERAFEPFFTTKGLQRAGLGLSASHGIVSTHGGSISAESREKEGTTFTVRLPFEEEPRQVLSHTAPELDLRLRMLVIDDVEPVLSVLAESLAGYHQTVFSALSGEEGVELFRENPLDVVICDLGMPGMNGWQVGRVLKGIAEQNGVPKTPFILITGWGWQFDDKEKMESCGVDCIVEKPIDVRALLEVVRKLLQE